jgi:uncharacterized membrane-anchored protein
VTQEPSRREPNRVPRAALERGASIRTTAPTPESRRPSGGAHRLRRTARKVPKITAYFWIVKILTTAMGEATSDYLVHRYDPVLAVAGCFVVFAAALVLQLWVRRYVAWVYWLAVVMVAVFGTMAADVLHIRFHVPYAASTVLFAVVLTAVFVLWNATERTLSIHSINTPRREVFYWATVLATFALGTAVGDLTALTLGLGYLASGVLFSVLILVPAVGYRWLGFNPVFAFWTAYVLTRPLGASYADWIGKPKIVGGLGVGPGPVAVVLTVVIAGFVAYLAVSRCDVETAPAVEAA